MRAFLVLLLLGSILLPASAQSLRRLDTSFEREVGRYGLRNTFAWQEAIGGWQVDLTNQFLSDAYDGTTGLFRDVDLLDWQLRRRTGRPLALSAYGDAEWYRVQRVFRQTTLAGFRWQVQPGAWVEPAAGVTVDMRPGAIGPDGQAPLRQDAGPAAGLRAALERETAQYSYIVNGVGRWRSFSPRSGSTVRLLGRGRTDLGSVRLDLEGRLARLHREAYQSVSFLNRSETGGSRIEGLTRDTLRLALQIRGPLAGDLRFGVEVDYEQRGRSLASRDVPEDAFSFDVDAQEQALRTDGSLLWQRGQTLHRLVLTSEIDTREALLANRADLPPALAAQRADLLAQTVFDRSVLTLQGESRLPTGPLLSRARALVSATRYDTPEANSDDRDMLTAQALLGTRWQVDRTLATQLQLDGSFDHTVYLSGLRSSENNRRYTLQLRPETEWRPSDKLRARLHSAVRATYTVYDYEIAGRPNRDQSAREFRLGTEIEAEPADAIYLRGTLDMSHLRLGRLLWDRFAEIPFDTLRTTRLRLSAGADVTSDLYAQIGMRMLHRSSFEPRARIPFDGGTLQRSARRILLQIGPTAQITWRAGRSQIELGGWLAVQQVRRRVYGPFPDGERDAVQRAATEDARVIPRLALRTRWLF